MWLLVSPHTDIVSVHLATDVECGLIGGDKSFYETILKVLRPANSIKVFVVFLGPRANAELLPNFHVALHDSHAALPMVTLNISLYTNVTLTFDFDFGLDHAVHGGYGRGSPTRRRKKVTVKQRN
jgi:hypothetical protein